MEATLEVPCTIHTVFFDAGNTLVGIDVARLAEAVARAGIRASGEAFEKAEIAARLVVDRPEHVLATLDRNRWKVYFRDMLASVGCSDEARVEAGLLEIEAAHHALNLWQRVAPGTEELLSTLEERGYRLGVISNADGRVRSILERNGLLLHFSCVIDSHLVGVEKPDPAIFLMGAAALDAEPARCLYIGDIFHVDVVGARAAGFFPVLLDPAGNHGDKDCLRVSSLTELAAHLPPLDAGAAAR